MATSHGHIETEDGARLFFKQAGTGDRTLFVLNGFYLFEDFSHLAEDRTVIGLDLRNRGRSDPIEDPALLAGGVEQDTVDIEAVRRHFGVGTIDLLAHSYAGLVPILYAQRNPSRVGRVVQISPMPPSITPEYPAHLTNHDARLQEFATGLGQLQARKQTVSPMEFCREFWALLRPLYVFNGADAEKIRHWESCGLPAEGTFMRYWSEFLAPSIERAAVTERDLAGVTMPVLVIHGTKDRSAAYGGGRDWAQRLPNARLLTVEDAAHVPWIESPDPVLGALRGFLGGSWPEEAEEVEAV